MGIRASDAEVGGFLGLLGVLEGSSGRRGYGGLMAFKGGESTGEEVLTMLLSSWPVRGIDRLLCTLKV